MVSQDDIDRLRLEADTIMTRIQAIKQAQERASHESGDHWETGTLDLELDTPRGEPLELTLPLDENPAQSAQKRYDRAAELETRLARQQRVDPQLAPMPADPLAYLICYHLDAVEGNYPKSIAGHLDAERGAVEDRCEEMLSAGLLERVESGTVKQRRVKAKQADEVRQHHTYYRLSREGDHLLRFLSTEDGKRNVLRHLPDGRTLVEGLLDSGPGSPRGTAAESADPFEQVRHRYRALARVGLLTKTDSESGDSASANDGGNHTYYEATAVARDLLSESL